MKLLIAVLLVVLLSGCTVTEPSLQTTAEQTISHPADETAAPQEVSPGTYLPDSPAEKATDGAVRVYAPDVAEALRLYPMGENFLLLSGGQSTTLTVLEGENLTVGAQREVNCLIPLEIGGIWVNENGVVYLDDAENSVVFLDGSLNEYKRVALPADKQGNALISPDLDEVFYCAGSAVRAVNLRTGLTRLIKTDDVAEQALWGVYCNGEVLCGYSVDGEGNSQSVYFSSENGATLYADRPLQQIATYEDQYLACFEDGTVRVCLTGSEEESPQMLGVSQTVLLYPVLAEDALITAEVSQKETELNYIDLYTGQTQGEIVLPGSVFVADVIVNNGAVYLLASFPDGDTPVICRWNMVKDKTESSLSLFQPYSTAENPDETGLGQYAEKASKIGEKFGIEILVWEDALQYQPSDQTMEAEYQVAAYERDLQTLEMALSKFPEAFFQALVSGTENEKLIISLVRTIQGDETLGSLEESQGVQFWLDGSAYITLAMGGSLEQTLYHELSHVIDNRVLGTTLAYDAWANLNPDDFEYDYSYITNRYREDYQYLNDENAAFIDMYSMSYPKEDRARILEYAMMPGNEVYFESEMLQTKLRTLCTGIREAFSLEAAAYPWEQYLKEPITVQ